MCTQAAAPSRETSSSLQTLNRVKNYKVVGKVSSYAKDLAEGSSIYNYVAPLSQKGVDKLAPYVPDVSQYVPNKYVQKVDSLGVTCLQRIEDVSTTSEKLVSARMKDASTLIQKFLPATEEAKGEAKAAPGLSTRIYSGVTGAVGSVSTTITSTVAPITSKIQANVVTPITTKVTDTTTKLQTKVNSTKAKINESVAHVTTRVSGAISTVKAAPQAAAKFREELTYAKVQEVAVASTSYGITKVGQVLVATKDTTIAYLPERYRENVEQAVASTEDFYNRLPTREEVRGINREQVKQGLKVIASNALAVAKSPVSYLWATKAAAPAEAEVPAPATPAPVVETIVEAVAVDEDEQPDAECEGEAPAPEVN